MRRMALWAVLTVWVAGSAAAEECLVFDTTVVVPGKVAVVEDYWVLQVLPPICVDSPPGDDLGTPAHNVTEIQLVFKDPAAGKSFARQSVRVSGHLSPPHGVFNRRPVILEVETLKKR